jgi:hypothetical protein
MAVKFSQFNVASTTSDIDYLVGYKSTDNVQIPVGLVGSDTTYGISTAQSGANETITLTGSDSSTDLITITAGSDISLTDDGAGNGFTIASTAGVTVVKDQFTGNNSTTGFTLSTSVSSADNLNIFISGVYQNSVDSGGTANYSVAGTTLTFVTPPPTTATNGIEVVITQ